MHPRNIDIDIDIQTPQWNIDFEGIESLTEDTIKQTLSMMLDGQKSLEISVVLTDDEFIQNLNKTYREKDKPTNVLSFPMSEPEDFTSDIPFLALGDIIVSFETIKKEATEQNKPIKHHYMHMLVHSCLHLLHYDHENDEDANIMESEEIRILEHFKIKNPYEV